MTPADVLEIVRSIAGIRDRGELVRRLIAGLRGVIPAERYTIVFRHGRHGTTIETISEPPVEIDPKLAGYRIPEGAASSRAYVLREADLRDYPKHAELWRRQGMRCALRIPMIVEGVPIGQISMLSSDLHAYDGASLDVASELGNAVAVIFDSCCAYEHLSQLRDDDDENNASLRDDLDHEHDHSEGMVGQSPAFAAVKRQIEVVAPTDATILITGESGTGKDVVARAIHAVSTRRDRPLITVNCAAIPSSLAESELFGHEEGAFTGAGKARAGRFEQANGGTIFLDEVGELPLDVQAKLLRVIQEREVERVGGHVPIRIDVRILAATNRNLQERIRADQFREDLYYRLAVFPLHLPPLRARLEDLADLVDHFVKHAAERFHLPPRRVTREAIRRLADHDWPGNIRELQHAIERAMIVSPGEELAIDTVLPPRVAPPSSGDESDALRRQYLAVLDAADWVIEGAGGAAIQLKLHPNTLRHRLKRMGISRPGRA